jgi:hypothetical protein
MKLNADIKDANKIYAGFKLTLPEAGSVEPSPDPTNTTPQVSPTNSGTESALPGTLYGANDGFSSSMQTMNDEYKKLEEANKAYAESLKPTPESTALIEKQYANKAEEIKNTYESGMEDVELVKTETTRLANRALDMLQLSPVAIKSKVEDYTSQVTQWGTKISNEIKRLTSEETRALEENDINALDAIRKNKQDYEKLNLDIMTNHVSFMNQAFNMMLSTKQLQSQEKQQLQTEATNILNYGIQAIGVGGYESLDSATKEKLEKASLDLGMTPAMLQGILNQTPDVMGVTQVGDYKVFYDKKGNTVRQLLSPTSSSLNSSKKYASAEDAFQAYISGDITKSDFMTSQGQAGSELLESIRGGMIWDKAEEARARIVNDIKNTPQIGYEDVIKKRDSKSDELSNQIIANYPQTAGIVSQMLIGVSSNPSGTLSSSDQERIKDVIRDRMEEYIPDAFLKNQITNTQKSLFDMSNFTTDEPVLDENGNEI